MMHIKGTISNFNNPKSYKRNGFSGFSDSSLNLTILWCRWPSSSSVCQFCFVLSTRSPFEMQSITMEIIPSMPLSRRITPMIATMVSWSLDLLSFGLAHTSMFVLFREERLDDSARAWRIFFVGSAHNWIGQLVLFRLWLWFWFLCNNIYPI